MIKILAIGNSFSQDATALLELLTPEIHVRNLYVPGCPLAYHSELSRTDEPVYEYQEGGEVCLSEHASLSDGLEREEWDFITVQQASGFSGLEESYYPYLPQLLGYIRSRSKAKIVFHQTWAYETGCTHEGFRQYDNDRKKMWKSIKETVEHVCRRENLPIIRVGEMIARLREHDFFNVERGGISLCRDGFHLSYNFGRCAAAGVWAKFFTGKIPDYLLREDLSQGYELITEELKKL